MVTTEPVLHESYTVLALIPLLPFLGFLVNAFFGKRLSKTISGDRGVCGHDWRLRRIGRCARRHARAAGPVRAVELTVYTWIASGDLNIPLAFRVDPLASVMILVITGIG